MAQHKLLDEAQAARRRFRELNVNRGVLPERFIAAGELHFAETANGLLLVCSDSLA